MFIDRRSKQVGKTYLVDKFVTNNYKYYVYINFEKIIDARVALKHDLDVVTILMNLSIRYSNSQFVPNQTILFLDEIQNYPQARTSSKFFTLDKCYDGIASDSLLGINYKDVSSYLVGRLEIDFMCSLNGNLTALEVKSGDNLKAKSLAVLMSDVYRVPYDIKLSKDNISRDNQALKLPWYMALFL